jgi:hypothetical protein
VPVEVSGKAAMHTPFSVMEFPRKKSVVYLPNSTTSLFLEQDEMIDAHQRRVARLANFALDPAKSTDLIAGIVRDFKSTGAMSNGFGANLDTKAAR